MENTWNSPLKPLIPVIVLFAHAGSVQTLSRTKQGCSSRNDIESPLSYFRDGDFIIGGILQVSLLCIEERATFSSFPSPSDCFE